MHMADETGMKVDDMEMKTAPQQYYLPLYAPSYYYPTSLVQYPAATTVTRTVGPWYQYPLSNPGLVPQVQQPNEAEERILPSETQAGEDESAALLLLFKF